jgi:hypothetical protein
LLEEPGRGSDAGQSEDDRQAKGSRVAEDARQGQAGGPGEQRWTRLSCTVKSLPADPGRLQSILIVYTAVPALA